MAVAPSLLPGAFFIQSDFVLVVATFGFGVYSQGLRASAKLRKKFEHQISRGQPEIPGH